jgi:hypothetical protein
MGRRGVLSGAVRSPVPDPSHQRKKEAGAPPELILCAALVSPGVRQGRGGEGGEGARRFGRVPICAAIGGHRQRTPPAAAATSGREAMGVMEEKGTRFSLSPEEMGLGGAMRGERSSHARRHLHARERPYNQR